MIVSPPEMLSRCLLALTALLCSVIDINGASAYTILVNGNELNRPNEVVPIGGLQTVTCRLGTSNPRFEIVFERIVDEKEFNLKNYYQTSISGPNTSWTYTLNSTDKQNSVSTYRCRDSGSAKCPNYVQVTLYSTTQRPPPGATIPGCPPGGSSYPPSSNPTTRPSSGGGTNSPRFTGLNPLIYTISAVILLGTLAIVAIITCWIRARRSYNRRMFQATTNPQDYLDYISDNEFTPLTTSEFVASLQERPPTYNESEEIEGQIRPEGSGEGSSSGETRSTQESSGTGEGSGGGGERTGTPSTSSSAGRVPPPRPPPPSSSSSPQRPTPQLSTSTSSTSGDHMSPTDSGTEAARATHSTASESLPDVMEDRTTTSAHVCDGDGRTLHDSQPLISTVAVSGDVPEVTEDRAVTGFGVSSNEPAVSGVDALLSMDMEIGNGSQLESQSQFHPFSPTSSESAAAVGTLIDLDSGSTGEQVASSSQSAFPHFLPEPTPEQISEIEAAIGAINKHMAQIRERTE